MKMKRFLRQTFYQPNRTKGIIGPYKKRHPPATVSFSCCSALHCRTIIYQESDHGDASPTPTPTGDIDGTDEIYPQSLLLLASPILPWTGEILGLRSDLEICLVQTILTRYATSWVRIIAKHEVQALPRLARLDAVSHSLLSLPRLWSMP